MNHTVFFLGMSVLQFIYILYQFLLLKRIEYLYYILYFVCVTVVIMFATFPEINPFRFSVTPEDNFIASRGLLMVAYAMYYKFGRYFTETKVYYKKLNQLLSYAEWFLAIYGTIDIITSCLGLWTVAIERISLIVYFLLIPFSVSVIIYMMTRGKTLTNILVIGSSLLFVFAVAGFVDSTFITKGSKPVSYYQLYMEIGVVLELLFLNFGLIYKTQQLEKANMRFEIAKQLELTKQRLIISSDLHDEIGTTLSGIALYSHLAGNQMMQHEKPALEKSLNIIQNSASEMVSRLNDIIWAVNPKDNNVEEMMTHVEEFLLKMAATKQINAEMRINPTVMKHTLPMLYRKNIYLICKEAINNAVKYSGCEKLIMEVADTGDELMIWIKDNGMGFDQKTATQGNGLGNMMLRAKQINAILQVISSEGQGTKVFLNCKIPQQVMNI